jgi:hypothetical protein
LRVSGPRLIVSCRFFSFALCLSAFSASFLRSGSANAPASFSLACSAPLPCVPAAAVPAAAVPAAAVPSPTASMLALRLAGTLSPMLFTSSL